LDHQLGVSLCQGMFGYFAWSDIPIGAPDAQVDPLFIKSRLSGMTEPAQAAIFVDDTEVDLIL